MDDWDDSGTSLRLVPMPYRGGGRGADSGHDLRLGTGTPSFQGGERMRYWRSIIAVVFLAAAVAMTAAAYQEAPMFEDQ